MSRSGWVAVMVVAASLLAGCAGEGTDETDRQAETLATAISWPRQYSADGFARAALATPLGQSNSFSVLEVTDLDAAQLTDPDAHLVIRIHHDAYDGPWGHVDPLTVCYGMDFNYYGIIDTPEQVGCPDHARPITYPPPPKWKDKAAFASALNSLMADLPPAPSVQRVTNALYGAWLLEPAHLVDDETTNLGPSDPRPTVRVRGDDVAVAITAGPECLLASRVRGTVTVRRPRPPVADCAPTL